VDWNSDHRRDLVSGDREGYLNLFIESQGQLIAYYKMQLINGDTIDVGNNAQPAIADWDRDGKKDLLLGGEDGYVRLYRNLTSDTLPSFQNYTYIQSGGNPINNYRITPYVVDLDQDGKRDLVCGAADGYLHFFQNVGSDTNPTFAGEETLKTAHDILIQPSVTAIGSRCGFGDWNNDGAIDFLLSGYEGAIELYLGEGVGVKEKAVLVILTHFNIAPNPAHSSVNISYGLECPANVNLAVYDASGRQVALLESGKVPEGSHTLRWNANVSAGVYLCKLTITEKTFTRRIVLTE
jgi:WD40 repeat protein